MMFENPANGQREEVPFPVSWATQFGPYYFAWRGMIVHALICVLLGVMTLGIAWIIYPFFTEKIVRNYYLRRGWKEIIEAEEMPSSKGTYFSSREIRLIWSLVGLIAFYILIQVLGNLLPK